MNRIEQMLQELCPNGVEYRKLTDICGLSRGKVYSKTYLSENVGDYPVYSSQTANNGELGKISTYDYDGEFLTWTTDGAYAGTIFHRKGKFSITNVCGLISLKSKDVLIRFLYYWLSIEAPKHVYQGMGNPKLMSNQMEHIEIPVPPLPIQEEIVRILDHFTELTASLQAELQARQEQYEYYRNRLLSFDDDIPKMKLNDIVTFMNGKGHEKYIEDKGAYIVVNSKFISSNGKVIKYSNSQISPVYEGMILMVMSDLPNGKALARCFVVDADNKYTLNQRIGAFTIRDKKLITTPFLYYILNRNEQLLLYDNGVDQTNLRKGDILNIVIPIPPISEQQRIVAILDKFETLVNDLSQGLPAEIAAVQEQYEYYRNKLLTFNHIESN